jgi:DNA-binding IclR family transcriptional regulator
MVQPDEEISIDGAASLAANRAPAVSRAAAVLRMLANEQAGLGVSEIARRVGLVPSTCLHILRALVEEGFLSFDETNKSYRTGAGLLTLVRHAHMNSDFPRAVQPALDALAKTFPVTAIAVEMAQRNRTVVVALARSDAFVSLHINIGSRFPAYISAVGRCFAAASGLGRQALKAQFEALRWEAAPTFDAWMEEVDRARREEVATDYGHFVKGLTVVATMIPLSHDNIRRGISVVGFEHQLSAEIVERIKAALPEIAKDVAGRLK